MSRLTRILNRCNKDIQNQRLTPIEKFMDFIDHNHTITGIRDFYYQIKNFFHNFPMFIRFSWGYRRWDYSFNLEIFVRLLEETGKALRYHGWAIDNEKNARRCFTAAGLLRKAYLDQDIDKTILYLMDKNPYIPKSLTLEMKFVTDKRIYDGMYKVANKRSEQSCKQLKQEAWQYLNKYIEHMWD